MKTVTNLITKIYRQTFHNGILLAVVNFIFFGVGLAAILSIESSGLQLRFLVVYLILALILLFCHALIMQSLYKNTQTSLNQAISEQSALANRERSINQLQVAAEIARDATSQANLQGVLDRTVQLICERFNFYHAGIFLIDKETDYAVIRAAHGVEASHQMLDRKHRLKVGEEGIVGFVTSTGQPLLVLDTDEDHHYYKNPILPETRSELAVPFQVGNQIIGALDVQSLERDAFDQDDVSILQTMADLLAVAIEKANLNEVIQAHANVLEQRVQERTQELESERAQLQVILNSMGDGLIYDEEFKAIYTNRALTELTGYTLTEWSGMFETILPANMSQEESRAMQNEIYDSVGKKGIWEKDIRLVRADGTEFDANVLCTAVQRDTTAQHAKGAVTIIRDISQQKALEEQKSRFIANAAHELRTPLANMKTRLYLIRHQPDKFNEHYDVLRSVTGRMQRLIDDLLDMSRFERGKIQLIRKKENMQHLIHNIIVTQRPEAEAKSIDLLENFSNTPLYANIDKDRMVQVLTNLISNAINYTDHGQITVHLRTAYNQQIEICVEDTGMGIESDMLEKIFQPFIRVNYEGTKGTGLGLNIAREIIMLHDGDLTVESVYGEGSKFYVRLEQMDNQPVSVS